MDNVSNPSPGAMRTDLRYVQDNPSVLRVLSCSRYGSQRFDSTLNNVRHRQHGRVAWRSGDGRNCGIRERLRPLARLTARKPASFFVRERAVRVCVAARTPPRFSDGDEEGDGRGVWMSVWVDDVDQMHKHCVAAGLEVTFPPTDMPWNVREMHLRHSDGHVFRVGRGFEPKK